MAAHGEFDAVGDNLPRRQRGFHAGMAHGDAVGDSNGAEFARGGAARGNAALDDLRLAHQRDIAGRCLVPAGGNTDERLMDLLGGQTHRVIKGAMRRTLRAFGGVPARQFRLQTGLGVHSFLSPGTGYGFAGVARRRLSRRYPASSGPRCGLMVWPNRGASRDVQCVCLNLLLVLQTRHSAVRPKMSSRNALAPAAKANSIVRILRRTKRRQRGAGGVCRGALWPPSITPARVAAPAFAGPTGLCSVRANACTPSPP